MPKLRRVSGAEIILDTGTCRAILRQASRFIPEDQMHTHFYTD